MFEYAMLPSYKGGILIAFKGKGKNSFSTIYHFIVMEQNFTFRRHVPLGKPQKKYLLNGSAIKAFPPPSPPQVGIFSTNLIFVLCFVLALL